MTGRDQILELASIYGQALGLERTTVSWRLFQDTNKLDAIAAGRDLYLGRYERAMRFFADSWPPHLDWPEGITRPAPARQSA
ncbi:hypothetical protein [Methylobacterium sp. Leaf118]|uniref:hypothetical protein n=1 Tax=Methylobacterium sp. Leaf118 TaxID=2876562 RepID=UPI001E39FB69|nr:hypothetical protein [Methylobacterium sp. Leaf118]